MALDKKLIDPLLADLKARLEAAQDDDEKSAAREAFFDDFKDAASDIYNPIHTVGFDAGKQKGGKSGTAAAERAKKLEDELKAAREELEEVKAKTPDVAAIEKKYADKLSKLEKERETERTEREAADRRRLLADARKDIESTLVAQGMRQKVARGEVARLVEEGFIALSDDGKSVEYRRLDDKESLYPAPRGDAPAFDGLIKAAIKAADPADLTSNVDRGNGRNGDPRPVNNSTANKGAREFVTRDEEGAEKKILVSDEFMTAKRDSVRRTMGM